MVWYDVLTKIQIVSKMMQSPKMQVDVALSLQRKTERELRDYRATGFLSAQMLAKEICESMNVEAVLQQKRVRTTKRHFSYESFDESLSDALKKLEVTFLMSLLIQQFQPFRKDLSHWKMWERSFKCYQPSKGSPMRS